MPYLYPMIDTDNMEHMSEKMRHALTLFEASNVTSMKRKFQAAEVRSFIAENTGDAELARTFEPRFLFSVT